MQGRRVFAILILAGLLAGGWLQVSGRVQAQLPAPAAGSAPAATHPAVSNGTRKLPPPPNSVQPVPADPSYRPLTCSSSVVNVSQTPGNESESFTVVNPGNPNNIVVFSNVATANSIFRAYSFDGGITWTRGTVATNVACCDGQATFDSFGNLFLVYINGSVNQINVILSTDGGMTFSGPVTAGTGSVDQPSIAAGNGSLWIDWNLNGNMVARGAPVTGLGTWGPFGALQTIPNATGSFGGITVGPGPNGGKVMVTYMNPTSGQGPATIYVNVDADGLGAGGFGARITVTNTNVGGFDYIPAQSTRSIDAEPGLVWDATGGPFNNRVYMVYTEEPINENNDTEIYLRTSTDDGTTWTSPVRVNDDPLGPIRSQFLPYIALDHSTGTVAIGWHDARNDNGVPGVGGTNNIPNDDAEYYASSSTDGGVTWAPNTRLSGGFSNAAAAGNGVDYGDYVGATAAGGNFVAVWADNANCDGTNPNGTLHAFDLYMGKLTLPAQGTATPTPTGALPTASATRTATGTPTTPPSATRTATATPIVALTSTPTATAGPANTATGTSTAVPTSTGTTAPTSTAPPAGTATPAPSSTTTGTATLTPAVLPSNTPAPPSTTPVAPSNTPALPTATSAPPSATPTVCVLPFSDVPSNYWAYTYISWVYCHSIVSGYADGTFHPEADTTRAQIAKMVVLAAGFALDLPPGAPHFSDAPPANPFYTYIEVAYAHNVISGYADGTFHPYQYVTRAQLAKMIVVARGLALVTPGTATFNDVPPGYWAYSYIETANANNIVGGYVCGGPGEPCPGRYFRADALATRAQLSKMLYQAFALPGPAGRRP